MSPELESYLPADPTLLAHCRRVAAVAQCIGHQLFLDTAAKGSLKAGALLHHLRIDGTAPALACAAILQAFHRPVGIAAALRQSVDILNIADNFDQLYEARPIEPRSPPEIIAELRRRAEWYSWGMEPVNALDRVMRETEFKGFDGFSLPVFPQAAYRALQLIEQPDSTVAQIESIVSSDPAIAASVVRAANSALFMGHSEVLTIRNAVTRLGYGSTRKIILATALRPVFARASMQPLLLHSLKMAELVSYLAAQTRSVDPEEAFLCGLLHDIGKLLLDRLNIFDSGRIRGLTEHGCPAVYAENLLIGCDHGELGGSIASSWKFPPRLGQAIQNHHTPERTDSPLAHLLYLGECRLDHLEDLPSPFRLELCERSTGIAHEALEQEWEDDRCELLIA